MKKSVDCTTGIQQLSALTIEEQENHAQQRIEWEWKESQPKPPSVEEKLQLLQQAMDELLLGGM